MTPQAALLFLVCLACWTRFSAARLIYADRNVYSVPSRLIGEQVEARLYLNRVEVWYGQKKVLTTGAQHAFRNQRRPEQCP